MYVLYMYFQVKFAFWWITQKYLCWFFGSLKVIAFWDVFFFQFSNDFLMNFHPIQSYCRKNLFLIIEAVMSLSQASVAVLEGFSNFLWMRLYS